MAHFFVAKIIERVVYCLCLHFSTTHSFSYIAVQISSLYSPRLLLSNQQQPSHWSQSNGQFLVIHFIWTLTGTWSPLIFSSPCAETFTSSLDFWSITSSCFCLVCLLVVVVCLFVFPYITGGLLSVSLAGLSFSSQHQISSWSLVTC